MRPPPAPLGNHRFRVDLGDDGDHGFAEVIFPEFGAVRGMPTGPLVLRRVAIAGDLTLYRWWAATRAAAVPQTLPGTKVERPADLARDIRVVLLDESSDPALTWRFSNASPISISWSPLDANTPGQVIETLELFFVRLDVE